MTPTQNNHSPEAQRNRWERGVDFQEEFRESLRRVPKCWFKRLPDGAGPQPFDTLVLLEDFNLGLEFKRLKDGNLDFDDIRPNQVKGLVNFNNCLKRNVGAIAVHFYDPERVLDDCFLVSIMQLLRFYSENGTQRAGLIQFHRTGGLGIRLHRHESGVGWDLVHFIDRIILYREGAPGCR